MYMKIPLEHAENSGLFMSSLARSVPPNACTRDYRRESRRMAEIHRSVSRAAIGLSAVNVFSVCSRTCG